MNYTRITYIGQATSNPDRGWMTLSATVGSETPEEAREVVERIYGDLSVYMRVVKRTEEVVWANT